MPILRLLFVILVIVNLVLFSLGQGYLGAGQEGEGDRVAKQIAPDKLKLVREKPADKPAPLPAAEAPQAAAPAVAEAKPDAPPPAAPADARPAAPAPIELKPGLKPVEKPPVAKAEEKPKEPPQPVCRNIPTLTAEQATRAMVILRAHPSVKPVVKELKPEAPSAFWVNIPPQADRAAADARVADLKDKGVQDFFVVQEEGPNRYAISLGLYRQEKGANEYLARLKKLGVAQARITPRGGDARRDVTLRGPSDAVDTALAKLNAGLGELRTTACR